VNKESRISNQLLDVIKCYDLCDIYCADELALYYNAAPSLEEEGEEDGEGDKSNGVMDPDVRQITVLLCCNVTGSDKRDFVVVENSQQNGESANHSSPAGPLSKCHRAWAPHALLTQDVYRQFLLSLDSDMRRQRRYVLLLVDNAPPHVHDAGRSLEHVRVVFLRSYCTPFFHGIFYNVRAHYRRQLLQKMLADNPQALARKGDNKKKGVVKVACEEAVGMLKLAWQSVGVQDIVQCFSKAGVCPPHIHGLPNSGNAELPEVPEGLLTDEQLENFVNMDVDVQCTGDAAMVSAECRMLVDLTEHAVMESDPEHNTSANTSLNSSHHHQDAHRPGAPNSAPVKQQIITVPLPSPSIPAPPLPSMAPMGMAKYESYPPTSVSVHGALDIVRNYLEQRGLHLHNLHALEAQIASSMPGAK
jgi:hypothetical protein